MAEGKQTVKRVFGSLVNNATAIDGAKYSPWWVGLILFILGLLLPVVPIFVSSATTNGSSFLNNYEYGLGLEKTFGAALDDLDGQLTYDSKNDVISYSGTSNNSLIGSYISESGVCKGQYELRIYFCQETSQDAREKFVQSKENIKYKKGTIEEAGSSDENVYTPTTIYFFENSFYLNLYASNSTELKAKMGFFSDMTCYGDRESNLVKYFNGDNFDRTKEENRVNSYKNLKNFIDITYKSSKDKAMLWGTLMYIGVYFVLNMFMALMIFLMSRGKNNPNNYLTFWTCMKIDWWTSTAPGILALIFGFIFVNNAVLFEVMFLAMRIVWLSSKELRPQA